MNPAEAAIRDKMAESPHCVIVIGKTKVNELLSELDALRARCEAAEKLLVSAQCRGAYWIGADLFDSIDAHLKGAGRE